MSEKRKGRPSKGENKPCTFKLTKSVLDKLDVMQNETCLTKTVIVEKAIEMMYDYYQNTGKVVG